MKKMVNITISLILLLSFASIAKGADRYKIGYIDAQKILDHSKTGKKTTDSLEEYVKSRQKIIDLEEKEIKEAEEKLAKQASVLSPEVKKDKEDDLKRKLLKYQKKVSELNKEVQEKKMEVIREFNNKLEDIVKKIAEKEGYSFVLDKSLEGGVVVYADKTFDLTDRVIEEFDKIEE
ncbi:MAG: OmpH family outer membrane protein [Nitrospirota bacterium]